MAISIDIHALQTLPPSNINRDDTGAPKSAIFGGVMRQRVSSQAWKRAIRQDFKTYLDRDQLGKRTKRVAQVIGDRIQELDPSWAAEQAQAAVVDLFKATKIKTVAVQVKEGATPRPDEVGYLLFLSNRQIDRAAQYLIDHAGETVPAKTAKELLNDELSIDIAMFGRMVADDASMNVDAAVQVAHAIGVHESEPEFDYYTAVDDITEDAGEETGAGMIGTIQMMSSTLYRYASIDVNSLIENLGSEEAALLAIEAFVTSFIRSLPTGKLNTFANWTLPDLVYVTLRDDRPVSLVNAFESPVTTSEDAPNRREIAATKLANEAAEIDRMYDSAPKAAWILANEDLSRPFEKMATPVTQRELLSDIVTQTRQELA